MPLISVAEAAERYPLSVESIRRLARLKIVKAQRFGNAWAVDEASLKRYLRSDRRPGPKKSSR